METHSNDQDAALALLAWYRDAGVEASLGEAPVDWLAKGDVAPGLGYQWPGKSAAVAAPVAAATPETVPQHRPTPTVSTPSTTPRPQTPIAASTAETDARRAAENAETLEALHAALQAFNGCSLKATATKLCFYRGAPTARVMIIGEAPGRDEDLEGKPFVGRAGQLLDKMLGAIGLGESDVHITNVVYWRPPGNRTPTPQETLACRPFLQKQMVLVNPDIVVAVGGSAAKEVLGVADGIMKLRGKWRSVDIAGRAVPAIATLHPAYLLRTPAAKQLVWLDLQQMRARLRTG